MKGHKYNDFPKRHTIFRRIGVFLLTCSCLAILVCSVAFLMNSYLYSTIEQTDLFPAAETTEQETALSPLSIDGPEKDDGSEKDNAPKKDGSEEAWSLILVNKWNPIPDDYKIELTKLSNGESVNTRIYPALQEMFDAARKDNIYPVVASGYRTTKKQQSLMEEKLNDYKAEGYSPKEAKAKAEAWVAIPGTSEHQLGIAVDINADRIHSTGDEVYKWLDENACKFGFIRRYPPDKTEITGVINEPWHYRYVGVKAATEIQKQGVCLEEYLDGTE